MPADYRRWSFAHVAIRSLVAIALLCSSGAHAQSVFRSGFEDSEDTSLGVAPQLRILRDDRVATLEMDYDESAWGQFWTMDGSGDADAGFLVTWWPTAMAAPAADSLKLHQEVAACSGCLGTCGHSKTIPAGVKWLVTGNRRVQLQPLENGTSYTVRVERVDALGRISSHPTVLTFPGGDGARVAALRASLTYFDDFNLPMGAADESLWNNATVTSTDARFNLFFINDQYHAHTLQGTRLDNTGDKSQTAQRFRKKLRIENGVRRRIVFDMDSPLGPRSVWYLDLNPVQTDLTGHADFFDSEGALGLPAGMLRLRSQFQTFSVSLIGMNGASHQVASVDMQTLGRQAVSNVRRNFEVMVGTDGITVRIDGRIVIDTPFAPLSLPAGDYEPLWVGFGYNTLKDANPYYLVHWDNFGFDGSVVDARTVHNYVTRIQGTDYQKSNRGSNSFPTYTVRIPDDLRPVSAGATAEAWLVYTYQMGDFSGLTIGNGDTVQVNGAASHTLPRPINNSAPTNPDLMMWGLPHTVRVKLGDLVQGGASPLRVGDNSFRFFAENAGILNVHVEVLYPPGSAPAYTAPAAIHHFPMHAELPRLGPPARFDRIGGSGIEEAHHLGDDSAARIAVSGQVPLDMSVGNRAWAGWAPELMVFPVQSTEVWSTGGTQGIARVEVFLRPSAAAGIGERVLLIETARDAPAPQGRYLRTLDTTQFANGDYEIFVQATSPTGLKSHPSYGNETYLWDAAQLSGAYYPISLRIQN
jgi:hypothetical protein